MAGPALLLIVLLCVPAASLCASEAKSPADGTAEAEYQRGMALARLAQWAEARQTLEAGWKKAPLDKRFPLELAGIALKQKDSAAAIAHLRRALRLDPGDDYGNDFLATLYLLEDNLEAALKYWNRTGKPEIEDVRAEPEPRLDPVLLDRAFAFSRSSTLLLEDYRTTEERIRVLDVFPLFRFELLARDDGAFDVVFRPLERGGWSRGKLARVLLLVRGVPYQTIYPEFHNLRQAGLNIDSLVRWDSRKRRAWLSLSAPLGRDPGWRYRVYLDGRNEEWEANGSPARFGSFRMERLEAGAEVRSVVSGRWSWWSGAQVAGRSYQNARLDAPGAAAFLGEGFSLKYLAGVDRSLLRIPEARFSIDSSARLEFGKLFGGVSGAFSKLQAALDARWLPRAAKHEFSARLRAGSAGGRVPFDELFMLGVERDSTLPLRGHSGARNGRKGSAPLGRSYILTNWELQRSVFERPLFRMKAGPFLDSGRVFDSAPGLGSGGWLWDTGVQLRMEVPGGVGVVLSYGRDLRFGRGAFFADTSR
jgi:hypothetical protein